MAERGCATERKHEEKEEGKNRGPNKRPKNDRTYKYGSCCLGWTGARCLFVMLMCISLFFGLCVIAVICGQTIGSFVDHLGGTWGKCGCVLSCFFGLKGLEGDQREDTTPVYGGSAAFPRARNAHRKRNILGTCAACRKARRRSPGQRQPMTSEYIR